LKKQINLVKDIIDFVKFYSNNNKYKEKIYNTIIQKSLIFYNFYKKVEIIANKYNKIFLLILKNRISIYYYNWITKQ